MRRIWERYFLKKALKVFLLILLCFYGLYFLIDFSTRSASHHSVHSQLQLVEIAEFYFYALIQRLDVVIPFALLIATIRTLTHLNQTSELVALLASGVSRKKIVLPFVWLSLCCVGLIYYNTQILIPKAKEKIRHINDHYSRKKNQKRRKFFVQSVSLKDGTVLLFQDNSVQEEKKLFDVYWIKSFNEIIHMKYLYPKKRAPIGIFVNHFLRKNGKMEKVSSERVKEFPRLRFNSKVLFDTITPPEELSLHQLWKKLPKNGQATSEKEAQFLTVFYQKLVMPWLCLLAVLGPAPLCIRFSRYFPVFFIYSLSIFGTAACYVLLDAAAILGSRQVLPPLLAIGFPCLFLFGLTLTSYMILKRL